MIVLVDHDMEGQAALLWRTLVAEGWLEIVSLHLVTFADLGLPRDSADQEVWRFTQAQQILLLTNNRNATGDDSLGRTIDKESAAASLPVVTIGNLRRMVDREYREQCAERLAEIVLYLERYLGTGRIFIP